MSTRSRLVIDIGLFLALLAAFNPAITGIAIHEWLSIAIIPPLLLHLIVNWEWSVRVFSTFVDRLLHGSRLNLAVDATLFVSSVAVMLSGLMVSQVALVALGITASANALWVAVHAVTANTTIALLLVHFALHTKWIVRALSLSTSPEPRPGGAPVRIGQ